MSWGCILAAVFCGQGSWSCGFHGIVLEMSGMDLEYRLEKIACFVPASGLMVSVEFRIDGQ